MTAAPMRIRLTGASGFVGRHLLAALRDAFPAATIDTDRIDLTDPAAIDAAIAATRPDLCLHLAAVSTVREAREREDHAWTVNLFGALHLARAILRHAPACRLLFASSAEAYGASFRTHAPITEAAPLAPMNTYGATKAAADIALGAMAEQGLRLIRVRPFNHSGAGQGTAFVVAAFARQVARIAAGQQAPRMVVGNLAAQRDFLDVRDVCQAYVACIRHADALPPNVVLNLASGQPRRIGDILDTLIAMAGVEADVQVDPGLLRPSDLPLTQGDSALMRRLTGWQPTIPWDDTLRTVLADWRHRVAAGTD